MTVSIDDPAEYAEPFLGAALLASHTDLAAAISALADVLGTEDLGWSDNIRQQASLAAKGNFLENVPIETEAASLEFGLRVLEWQFQAVNADLLCLG